MKKILKVSVLGIMALSLFLIINVKNSHAAPLPLINPNIHLVEPVQINPAVIKAVWCNNIQKKVTAKMETFSANKDKNLAAFNNLKNRLDTLTNRLSSKGYDTAQLEADLDVLKTKIETFSNDYNTYKQKLEQVKSYSCDKSNAEFKAKLTEARTALKQVRKDIQEAKNYYVNEIKPDIKQVRNQKINN